MWIYPKRKWKKDDSEHTHTPFICHLLVLRRSIPPEQNVKHECANHKHLVGKVCRRVEVRTAVHVSITERHTGWPEDKYLPAPLEAIILFLYVDGWRSQACKEFRQHRHGIGTGKRGPGPWTRFRKPEIAGWHTWELMSAMRVRTPVKPILSDYSISSTKWTRHCPSLPYIHVLCFDTSYRL